MATLTRSNDMAILREDTLLLGAICLLRHDRIPTDLLYPPKELALPNIANFCYDAARVQKILKDLCYSNKISATDYYIYLDTKQVSFFYFHLQPNDQDQVFQVTSTLLNRLFPKQKGDDPPYDYFPICDKYIRHAQSLAREWLSAEESCRRGYRRNLLTPSPDFLQLISHAAYYLSEDGDFIRDFDGAIELINIGLRAAAYGKHDIFVAHLLNTRGVVKELTYQYQKAEQALEKSVTIWMRILGHLHLQSNVTLMNLASVRAAQGDYVQALQLYKHVDLAIAWFTDHEKQFALFRLAVNVGRCFAAICCGRYAGVCKDLLRIRDGIPHGWRESEPYRRKIEYWIGNLSLADGNKLEKAETSYRLCLTTRYPHEGTKENALLTVACYYKLAAVEFELSRGDPYRYPAALQHVNMAINLAKKYKSQGYLGRALLLKEEIARSTPSTYFEEPPENIRSKVDAVEADLKQRLQKLPNERVVLGTPLEIFCHFIPWQVR